MVPITVVTGFLGAGKTSLIAHLLDSTQDRRVGVVVNELAHSSIDSAYLHGGEHITVSDTPLLRSVSGGRAGAGKLEAVVTQVAELATTNPAPEAIVVETSGSSPVGRLVQALRSSTALSGIAHLDTVVAIVDGTSLGRYWKDPQLRPLLEDQMRHADLVVLNKIDRTGFWARRRALAAVRRANPAAEVGTTEFGRLPVEEIIATGRRTARPASDGAEGAPVGRPSGADTDTRADAAARFQPVVARHLTETRPFHPERLHQWLDAEWPGIVRVKGFAWLATDMEHVFVVDAAAEQREVGMEGTWYAAIPEADRPDAPEVQEALQAGAWGDRRQSLVVIGVPDAVERELRNLRACLLSGTELDRGPQGWRDMRDPISPQFSDATEGATAAD